MSGTVAIDCFSSSLHRYRDGYAVVAVDVIRATTTAATAVARGRRCYPVPSLEVAVPLAARLEDPLLVGELGGNMPYGFHLNNSPAELAVTNDLARPMILLSTSGTGLIVAARGAEAVYGACLRNYSAHADYLCGRHERIALVGAGTRNEFREEDQLCCAWIAERLILAGYEAADEPTRALVERWSGAPVDAITASKSARYLRETGQVRDLEYILQHDDDLRGVLALEGEELVMVTPT
jgi:2-phosphosulfolactate phosphatase